MRARKLGIKSAHKVISPEQKLAISRAVRSRLVWRIDWAKYDDFIKSGLPNHSVAEFCKKYQVAASAKQVAKRARLLGVVPLRICSEQKRNKIANSIKQYDFTKESDEFILKHKDDMGQREIANSLGVSHAALWRRMNELGLHRDPSVLSSIISKHMEKAAPKMAARSSARIRAMSANEYMAYRKELSERAVKLFKEGKIRPGRGVGQDMITLKGGNFRTRSSYETKYVNILESDPQVVKFEYEPFQIEYEHDGIIKSYTPDFLVIYEDHAELVEVKPSRLISMERNPAKFIAARRHCLDNDLDFVVVTEKRLFRPKHNIEVIDEAI